MDNTPLTGWPHFARHDGLSGRPRLARHDDLTGRPRLARHDDLTGWPRFARHDDLNRHREPLHNRHREERSDVAIQLGRGMKGTHVE